MSDDAVEWISVAFDSCTGGGWRTTALPVGTVGRYVRLDLQTRLTAYGFSFFEIQLYPSASASPSPPEAASPSPPPPSPTPPSMSPPPSTSPSPPPSAGRRRPRRRRRHRAPPGRRHWWPLRPCRPPAARPKGGYAPRHRPAAASSRSAGGACGLCYLRWPAQFSANSAAARAFSPAGRRAAAAPVPAGHDPPPSRRAPAEANGAGRSRRSPTARRPAPRSASTTAWTTARTASRGFALLLLRVWLAPEVQLGGHEHRQLLRLRHVPAAGSTAPRTAIAVLSGNGSDAAVRHRRRRRRHRRRRRRGRRRESVASFTSGASCEANGAGAIRRSPTARRPAPRSASARRRWTTSPPRSALLPLRAGLAQVQLGGHEHRRCNYKARICWINAPPPPPPYSPGMAPMPPPLPPQPPVPPPYPPGWPQSRRRRH